MVKGLIEGSCYQCSIYTVSVPRVFHRVQYWARYSSLFVIDDLSTVIQALSYLFADKILLYHMRDH